MNILRAPFILLRIALTILGLLWIQMNLRFFPPIFVMNLMWRLIGTVLNVKTVFNRLAILLILILSNKCLSIL